MRQYYLVCFDIEDDRVRKRIGDRLLKVGQRVQLSVFEVLLHSDKELRQLKRDIISLLDEADNPCDDVRFYYLNSHTAARSFTIDDQPVAHFPVKVVL